MKLLKWKIGAGVLAVVVAASAAAYVLGNSNESVIDSAVKILDSIVPTSFGGDVYEEPEFVDSDSRTNNAFNVVDFGQQGKNGWFYRYGDADRPDRSRQIENFDGQIYYQPGFSGLEMKNNFIHTAEKTAAILEWRAAESGNINLKMAYLKNVNADKNPSYPDGVTIYVYKGQELLKAEKVDALEDTENVFTLDLNDIRVEELESLYFVVAPNSNNAYDGGSLYVAISDKEFSGMPITVDSNRENNNASSIDDFGGQGSNGWTYLVGNMSDGFKTAAIMTEEGYQNYTSPNYVISKNFIHPSINDDAALGWSPAKDGPVEIRMKYTKFEQNDGNPDYPDGVTVSVYKNDKKLYAEKVSVLAKGKAKVSFRKENLQVTKSDKLYFVVSANKNASYDGGCFDIAILDREGAVDENSIVVDEPETRQNVANVMTDFGKQGENGWFFQEGYGNLPFTAYNINTFNEAEDRYEDPSYLEIKRDYVNTGTQGRSAVIKWRVAQNGTVRIDASYTKLKNEDKNPSWPDGTCVSIYHNETLLTQENFAADTAKEVTKRLDVASVNVARDDYITMVINGKDNNAYDGGNYEFKIMTTSGLVGMTEKDVNPSYDRKINNNADCIDDFGKQGNNNFYFQYGYNNDPFFAVNVERYDEDERRYITKDGLEIKNDYIIPGKNGKNANVKWVASEDTSVDIYCTYSKLLNEDKNPSWPDGVYVFLMKNDQILSSEEFAPLTDEVVTSDLSQYNVELKAGDTITLVVDGKDNTAYDGGNYSLAIEDRKRHSIKLKNNAEENEANLKADFGPQGSNGWYYAEGTSIASLDYGLEFDKAKNAYFSAKRPNLEIKADFVQPRKRALAVYQWVAAKDGKIDIDGNYCKFGHQDPNTAYPDGTVIFVYINNRVLLHEKVDVLQGEGHDVFKNINISELKVKAGDVLSFAVGMKENNAWDGGRYEINISDSENISIVPGDETRENRTTLGAIPDMDQGTDGWWFSEGTTVADSKVLRRMNDDKSAYLSGKSNGLEMKKDYVHTGDKTNPMYRWCVAQDGQIDIETGYVKFGHNDGNPSWPDGVTLKILKNEENLVSDIAVAVFQGDGNDNTVNTSLSKVDVKRGDIITFIIDANENNAWDAGKLSVRISPTAAERNSNVANLANDFGPQGSNGWYYGQCEWNGVDFAELSYNEAEQAYIGNAKPILKKDYVEPGNWKNAAYMWVAAVDGKIKVKGSYTQYANTADPEANGTCMRIFVDGAERKWLGDNTMGKHENDGTEYFDETYTVKKGDKIIFAVNPEGSDALDGGCLSVDITEVEEVIEEGRTNETVLMDDFTGEQGKNGWSYGYCDWDGSGFTEISFDNENGRYFGDGVELKADWVHPGDGGWRSAAYKWKAATTGTIHIFGSYTKYEYTEGDGISLRVIIPGVEGDHWQKGNSGDVLDFDYTVYVNAGDEIVFAINPEGNNANDGGKLAVVIAE